LRAVGAAHSSPYSEISDTSNRVRYYSLSSPEMQIFEKYVDPQNNDIYITAGAGLFMG
jgi:hypothetical protein